ncbi:MAG: DUF3106 domain-containing protein [Ferrovum sp.]|nr:DUF3106 domain-containing protein [Ferrovum sp.]
MALRKSLIFAFFGAFLVNSASAQGAEVTGWSQLSPQQQSILAPAHNNWDKMQETQHRRLINAAKHYPELTPTQQARFQKRLPIWIQLPVSDRERARNNFKKYRSLPKSKKDHIRTHLEQAHAPNNNSTNLSPALNPPTQPQGQQHKSQ